MAFPSAPATQAKPARQAKSTAQGSSGHSAERGVWLCHPLPAKQRAGARPAPILRPALAGHRSPGATGGSGDRAALCTPQTHPEPRCAGQGQCPPPAPAGCRRSPARRQGARPAPAPAPALPRTARRTPAPRCPPCGDTPGGLRPPGPAPHHHGPIARGSPHPPMPGSIARCGAVQGTYLTPVTSSRRNPGTDMKRGATCVGRKLSTRPPATAPRHSPVPRLPSG